MKRMTCLLGMALTTLILTSTPAVQAGPRNKQVRVRAPLKVKVRKGSSHKAIRWFSLRRSPRVNKATAGRSITKSKLGRSIAKSKLGRKLKSKLGSTRYKLKEWWRWQTKKDWKLVEVHPTDYVGMNASSLNPYFWNVWKDTRTGKTRITTDY